MRIDLDELLGQATPEQIKRYREYIRTTESPSDLMIIRILGGFKRGA